MTKRTVYVFHINILFDDCDNKLDLDEPPAREKKKQVLFRGVSKDNPHKAIVVVQA